MKMKLPNARTSQLLEQEAGAELMIYDLRIDKAYNLNETLKIVYKACGEQSFEDLKRQYKFTDDLIYFALDELDQNNLLENYRSGHFSGLSRREVVKRVGLATMVALPLLSGLIAPQAAHAASRQSGSADPNGCNQPGVDCCQEVECPYAQTQCQNDGTCDPNTGDCVFTNRPAGAPCDNGIAADGYSDVCDGNGNCISSPQ